MSSPGAEPASAIALISPFPREHYRLLDRWTRGSEYMRDDFWPREFGALATELDRRAGQELTCLVTLDGEPAGFIGYAAISAHLGMLRGVIFAPRFRGHGTAVCALRTFLGQRFAGGVHKILAGPFAANKRAIAFLYKLGARDEGLLREHTVRTGQMIDVRLMAFFAPEEIECRSPVC
ncbi:MAG TPA: GNAT family protein [Candidatus Binataceae bacterium]|nr:GNAT family protein [Candidatus Binataceae bacterium]